jgi:hypothetical protein
MSKQRAWHSLETDEAIKTLASDLTQGLSHPACCGQAVSCVAIF